MPTLDVFGGVALWVCMMGVALCACLVGAALGNTVDPRLSEH